MVHGINLVYLHLFDHDVSTSQITSVTTFHQIPQYTVAPFNIFQIQKLSVIGANLDQISKRLQLMFAVV